MFNQFKDSLTRTVTQIGKEFTSSSNEHIITYEANVLQYWWQCYKVLQIYRYLNMYTSMFDEHYFTQLKASLLLVSEHCKLIDIGTNCPLCIKQMIQLCSVHERIANDVRTGNNNGFFAHRNASVSIHSPSQHMPLDNTSLTWYEKLQQAYRTNIAQNNVDDSIGHTSSTTPFRIGKTQHVSRQVTDDEKRGYAYSIFLCYFYHAQCVHVGAKNARICRQCVTKMERYYAHIVRMEEDFTRRCTPDEQNLLIVKYFDLTVIASDATSMYYSNYIKSVIEEWKKKLAHESCGTEDIGLYFFNIETLREYELGMEPPSSSFISSTLHHNNKSD